MRYIRKNDERLFKKPREFWINAVSKWVKNEKARYCIIRNFCDYIPYETIAEELNISTSTVYRLIKKYGDILFENVKL